MEGTRRSFLFAAGLFSGALAWPRAARADTVVEDWRRHAVGTRGIPEGWKAYPTPGGHPAYDFAVVEVDGKRALHVKSNGDRSNIARAIDVNLAATPILEWSWKAVRLPDNADVRQAARSDAMVQLLAIWPRTPELIRSRILAYTWATTGTANSMPPSPKTRTVTFVVVRAGREGLGRWLTERRDVAADYRQAFGEAPEHLPAMALSVDTNDTRAAAEAFVGRIAFRQA